MTEAFLPLLREGFDPVPELGERRDGAPVTKLEFPFGISAWLITRFADVKQILGDPDAFSNDFHRLAEAAQGQEPPAVDPGGLGFADPPDHTRLRKLLTPEFTVRRLSRLIPRMTEIVEGQLDAIEKAGRGADLGELFATPIPSLVISELLGVPEDERAEFGALSESRFDIFANLGDPMGAISASLTYLQTLVTRERANPGEGLLGAIVRDHGDEISDVELAGLADGLLTGGHETTASMIALGTLVLLQRPDLADALRSGTDVNAIVEELLRYLTVVQVAFPRFALNDMEIGGVAIAQGEMILCSLSSANRDAIGWPTPDRVDPVQANRSHLAFGYGIHRCVGAELARIELQIAFPALLRRFPTLQLAVPFSDIAFRPYSIVHGVDALPVTW